MLDFAQYNTQDGFMSTPTTELFAHDSWRTERNARMFRALVAARNEEIAIRFRWLRGEKLVTQAVAAAAIGVTVRTLQNWESAGTVPETPVLHRAARYYGTTALWILHGDEAAAPATRFDRLEAEVRSLYGRVAALEAQLGVRGDEDRAALEPPASFLRDDEDAPRRAARRRRSG